MVEEGALDRIFSVASGVWAVVCLAAVALFRAWPLILERINERRRDDHTAKAGDWERIRAERNELRCLLRECERERSDLLRRAVQAEATLQGYGEALQQAQNVVSAERLLDAAKRAEDKK